MSNAHDISMLVLMVALILIGAAMGMDVGDE